MKVLNLFPPNFTLINKAFNVRGKRVIFAYGDTIYNPSRMQIPDELFAHEAVHGAQQAALLDGPDAWWKRYIADKAFRLEQELPAHAAEFNHLCGRLSQEHARLKALHHVADRLSSPLYGRMIDPAMAKRLILDAARASGPALH